MPAWLKKIVLDIMPSVAATIIGAYVVNYYIIPKSPAASARVAITSAEPKPADGTAADRSTGDKTLVEKSVAEKASFEKASFEKAVADKTAIEKTAEKAITDRSAIDKAAIDKTAIDKTATGSIEPRKSASKPSVKPASIVATEPSSDERNTSTLRATDLRATDLARAAIERLRGNGHAESKESAKLDSAKTPDVARSQTVSTVATPTIPPMQPLPPAISVAAPNSDVFDQGSAAPVMRQPLPQAASRTDDRGRFAPPADIPVSRPIDLRAEAASDRGSVADDVMSAAKSMFHAVIPR